MKGKIVSILVLMLALSSLSLSAQQKDSKITINSESRTLMDCIKSIEKQTGYSFIFNSSFDVDQNVSVSLQNANLDKTLTAVFTANGIEYEIRDSHIVLKGAEVKGGSKIVRGIVVDNQKIPIPGAAILENSKNGVASDLDGNFEITVPADVTSLRVSCLGYTDKTVTFGKNADNITIVLDEDLLALNESVVVGYGTQKKVNLTGAIATVSADNIENRTAPTLTHMLQGSVPGLNISTSSGRPGNEASINIRGINSINGGNPLVLVDGAEGDLARLNPNDVESISVIKDASSAAIYGARASAGVILVTTKNGSDSDGKATVRYSGRLGWNSPTTSTDYETRGYYSVYINNLFWRNKNGTNYADYSEEDMQELWNRRNDVVEDPSRPWVMIKQVDGKNQYVYYANTDWYHHLFTDVTPMQSHNISVSGGSKRVKYYLSGSYDRQDGVYRVNRDRENKFNFRSKVSFDINKWMKLSNNTSFYSSVYNFPGAGNVNNAFSKITGHALASYPTQNPDGTSISKTTYSNYKVMDGLLPILDKGQHTNQDAKNRLSTTTELTISPIEGLDIVANFTYSMYGQRSMNRYVNTEYSTYPGEIITETADASENKLVEKNTTHHYYQTNIFATYNKSFKDSHNLKVMAGFNYEAKDLKDITSTGYDLMSDTLNDFNLLGQNADGEKRTELTGGYNEYALAGVFGRVNYDYKGRYLVEATARFDGSSRFAQGHRWGFFPSASAGWRISEEPFFAPVRDWFNNLKIRYSYGRLGNQQVGYYDYIRKVSLSSQNYLFGGGKSTVATLSDPVAGDLTWEISEQNNLGLDMAFFNNRLGFTGEAYIRDTKNMLTAGVALPATYGASSPKMNSADMRTKGYELQLSWRDGFELLGDTFNYSVTASFSDYKSVITKFDNPEKSFAKNYYEGMVWGEIWGYEVEGLFKTDQEAADYIVDQTWVNSLILESAGDMGHLRAGDLKYVDLDGDNKISIGKNTVDNPGDRKIIGNSQPRYNYGLNLSFNWHGVDFSVFFQGVGKRDWYPASNAILFWGPYARPYATLLPKDFHKMYWTEDNPDAYFPRPRGFAALKNENLADYSELTAINTRYLQNIGYCRLKNLTVGYTLPEKWTNAIGLNAVRFYFSGENLAYISGIKSDYIDPEMAATNGEMRIYPWQKTFMFGLDLTF